MANWYQGGYGNFGFGGGPFGSGGNSYALPPTFQVDFALAIAPDGAALRFNEKLDVTNAARLDAASYTLEAITFGANEPDVLAVYDVGDTRQVGLRFDGVLTYGAAYRITVVGAVTSESGDSLDPAHDDWVFSQWECLHAEVPRNPGQEPILQAYSDGIGRSMAEVAGWHMTRLARDLEFGDTEIVLDSTLAMADSGTILVGGRRFDYDGREPYRLLNLTPHDPDDRLWQDPADPYNDTEGKISAGTIVLDWGRNYSHRDFGRRSSYLSWSDGVMLNWLGARAKIPRFRGLSDDVYRNILLALVYQERSVWATLYKVLRAIFDPYAIDMTGVQAQDDYIGESGVFTAAKWMQHCYIENEDRTQLYRVRAIDDGVVGKVYPDPNPSPWALGWDWVSDPTLRNLRLQPFTITERMPEDDDPDRRIIVGIDVWLPPEVFPLATYLLDPPVYSNPVSNWQTPPTWPLPPRGFIEESAETSPDEDSNYTPLYLSACTLESIFGDWILQILRKAVPAACRLETSACAQ